MRQWLARITVLSILLFTMAVSVIAAAPAQQGRFGQLVSLSAYFPKDSLLYAAMRTDAPFLAAADRLVESVTAQLPSELFGEGFPVTLTRAFDLITQEAAGGGFEAAVRPWLGDTLAVGVYPAPLSAAGRVVIKITDAQAALAAVQNLFPGWTRRSLNGYVVLAPTDANDRNRIAIYDEVLIIYSWSDDLGPQQVPMISPDITASPYFSAGLERLPEAGYDLLAFVDTPLLLAYNERNNYRGVDEGLFLAALYRALGTTVLGGRVVDDQTIAVDMAQAVGNRAGLNALGVQFRSDGAVLDTALLESVPRDAFMVMQVADAADILGVMGGNMQAAANKFQMALPSLIAGLAYSYSASTVGLLSGSVAGLSNPQWAEVLFANLSGFDYTGEIQPLLAGQAAFFLSFNPAYNPTSSRFLDWEPFDGAFVFSVDDAAAAQAFLDKLTRELAISLYSSGNETSARFSPVTMPGNIQATQLTIYGVSGQAIEQFAFATDGEHLLMGTERAVRQVLGGEGLGFIGQPTPLLNAAGAALYMAVPPARSPEWRGLQAADPGNSLLQLLPYLVNNLTISVAGTAENDLLMRLVITVPCGDNCG